MATPQSTASFQGAASEPKRHEQITFRFCSECSNMLYPKEDEDSHRLQFTCRTCQYTEAAQSTCIYRNELNNSAGETAGVTQDVGSDPTVSSHHVHVLPPVICLCCGSAISCEVCGVPCADLPYAGPPFSAASITADGDVAMMEEEEEDQTLAGKRSLGLCRFTLDWDEEDLFDDEERGDGDFFDEVSDDASDESTVDGAMIIDL